MFTFSIAHSLISGINDVHCIIQGTRYFTMATLMVYKRNSKLMDLYELVEELSGLGLIDTLEKY